MMFEFITNTCCPGAALGRRDIFKPTISNHSLLGAFMELSCFCRDVFVLVLPIDRLKWTVVLTFENLFLTDQEYAYSVRNWRWLSKQLEGH